MKKTYLFIIALGLLGSSAGVYNVISGADNPWVSVISILCSIALVTVGYYNYKKTE